LIFSLVISDNSILKDLGVEMLKSPISAKNIRVRLHWAGSAEELAEEVNSNLDTYPGNDIYGMDYQVTTVFGDNTRPHEKHFMAVYFRP
jgi:hypothetical protein